jgi:TusA-related sulfurtransferase
MQKSIILSSTEIMANKKKLKEICPGDIVKVITDDNTTTMVFAELDGVNVGSYKKVKKTEDVGAYSIVTFEDGSVAHPFNDEYAMGTELDLVNINTASYGNRIVKPSNFLF